MSRVSRAENFIHRAVAYPTKRHSCSHLAASELFLGRQGGGILFFRTQVKHSAAAPVLKGLGREGRSLCPGLDIRERGPPGPRDPVGRSSRLLKFRKLDIYHEFKEYASGTDDNRPVLRQMLDEAKKGKFDCIIVFRIDRLTRSPLKLLLILEELQDPRTKKYNVNLISATEGVDMSSRLSEGMLLMLGIFAKMERDGIEERVRSGMDRAKRYGTKSGMPIGRPRTKIPWDGIDLYIKEHTYYRGAGPASCSIHGMSCPKRSVSPARPCSAR